MQQLRRRHTANHYDEEEDQAPEGTQFRAEQEPRYEPIDPPKGYSPLDFCPAMLKPAATIALSIFYAGIAAAIAVIILAPDSRGPYLIRSDSYYFAASYGPGLLAAISSFLYKITIQEFLRMLPYINMSNPGHNSMAYRTVLAMYWPLLYTKNTSGTRTIFVLNVVTAFLLSYKAAVFEVVNTGTTWNLYIHTWAAAPLILYYSVVSVLMAYMTCWLWNRGTGLRKDWDPECIADIMALFCHFDMDLDEIKSNTGYLPCITRRCENYHYRLGYWKTEIKAGESISTSIVYGIRTDPTFIPSLNLYGRENKWQGRVRKRLSAHWPSPYIFAPWADLGFWLAATFVLISFGMCALIAISGYLRTGFVLSEDWTVQKLDPIANQSLVIAASNATLNILSGAFTNPQGSRLATENPLGFQYFLVFRILPLVVVCQCFPWWYQTDAWFRWMQPFYNMSRQNTTAEESLLLDYLNKTPFYVTAHAFKNGYWKAFVFSLLGSSVDFLQLFPYGSWTIGAAGRLLIGRFSITAFSVTWALVILTGMAMVWSYPTGMRRIPRPRITLLDLWLMCHKSHVSTFDESRKCTPKRSKLLHHAAISARMNTYRLGILQSADGLERIGFDVHGEREDEQDTGYVRVAHARGSWLRRLWHTMSAKSKKPSVQRAPTLPVSPPPHGSR
ncbi:hypothetical protein CKM354_000604800 [Cercospora kikuchii]|uniref:Uncharacterized protein n=1 Tax=Cercospora kikuchii TaxID=84275 RepID=A0A9P3CQV5_9PEZI|nr:uncharacterized protein CKM354_000604800 [Cercospora kikuchii]GIZ42793.1 hypothetical protein CKM354_000604800 [Cercospora kikuchii]